MKRRHRYGLEAVPTFEQAAALKPVVKRAPPALKALDIWNSPRLLGSCGPMPRTSRRSRS